LVSFLSEKFVILTGLLVEVNDKIARAAVLPRFRGPAIDAARRLGCPREETRVLPILNATRQSSGQSPRRKRSERRSEKIGRPTEGVPARLCSVQTGHDGGRQKYDRRDVVWPLVMRRSCRTVCSKL